MTRQVRLQEVLLGVEGGALLRRVIDGDEDFVAERVAAIRRLAERLDGDRSKAVAVPELDVEEGYAAWAHSYNYARRVCRQRGPIRPRYQIC